MLRLDHYARQQVQRLDNSARHASAVMAHVNDLQALLAAVEQYEQAALASLPPAPVLVGNLSPAQLLAYREADPIYRLGWVRGHKAGVAQGQRAAEPAMRLYAQHAPLPVPTTPPTDYAALVQQVRAFLDQMTQRYGTGPITRPYYAPTAA
ncbi:hypothetical protein GCM10023172_27530 [Hymenobacter ginsengisoli]|uniref:Uncharacterized protein n=1 Tax=Hymenobacter ginsengisoli TaxID=1051626 RepID=A0ABP8QGQ4_9BACT